MNIKKIKKCCIYFLKPINAFFCIFLNFSDDLPEDCMNRLIQIGIIDDINVKNELMSIYTIIPLFSYEGSNAEDMLFDNFDFLMDNNDFCAGAVLYNNEIDPAIAVVIDGETSNLGMLDKVNENSEVHFIPAMAGG